MADPTDSAVPEAVAATATTEPAPADQIDEHEGDNNFQKAISAWRSMASLCLLGALADL